MNRYKQNPHYNCDECKWIEPKEKDQTNDKEPHICLKYNKRVYHNGNHPYIKPLEECDDKVYSSDSLQNIMDKFFNKKRGNL